MEPGGSKELRAAAEQVRRDLRIAVARGASPASFLPIVRRAQRHVRKGDLEGALRVLIGLDTRLRERLSEPDHGRRRPV